MAQSKFVAPFLDLAICSSALDLGNHVTEKSKLYAVYVYDDMEELATT